jgi:hypothetical protein
MSSDLPFFRYEEPQPVSGRYRPANETRIVPIRPRRSPVAARRWPLAVGRWPLAARRSPLGRTT